MPRTTIQRLSISMDAGLVARLDSMARAKGFASRSQAVSDMVRAHLVEHYGRSSRHAIAGTITLVYDHHQRNLQRLLTAIQHDHSDLIVAALHVHLDHHNCMEILAVRGTAGAARRLADGLTATRGVKHGRLTLTTTGREFPK